MKCDECNNEEDEKGICSCGFLGGQVNLDDDDRAKEFIHELMETEYEDVQITNGDEIESMSHVDSQSEPNKNNTQPNTPSTNLKGEIRSGKINGGLQEGHPEENTTGVETRRGCGKFVEGTLEEFNDNRIVGHDCIGDCDECSNNHDFTKNEIYKCGHKRDIVILDDNELSMVGYFDWKESVGYDGDKTKCWDCYCKDSSNAEEVKE